MTDPQELLDRVVLHMMEENKEEIDKAFKDYLMFGTFCLRHKDDGRVEAVSPLDIVKMGEEE